MKSIFLIILILIIAISCQDNSTNPIEKETEIEWTAPPTNEFGFAIITSFPDSLLQTYGDLRVLGAADERVAWVSDWTTNKLLKTEDGGTSWILQSPPLNGSVYSIEVYDSLYYGSVQRVERSFFPMMVAILGLNNTSPILLMTSNFLIKTME